MIFTLLACTSPEQAVPSATAPAETVATTPPRPLPTPPPPWVPPDPATLLVDIAPPDWPALCDQLVLPTEAQTLVCGGHEIVVPAESVSDALIDCVASYGDAASLDGCDATVADLEAWLQTPLTCEHIAEPPPSFERTFACASDPTPLPAPDTCGRILEQSPAHGATDVPATQPFRVVLNRPDTVHLRLLDGDLEQLGTTVDRANTHELQLDQPMLPARLHRVRATWCDGLAHHYTHFRTADDVTIEPEQLDGMVLALDPTDARWIQPSGGESSLAFLLEGRTLVAFTTSSSDAITARIARETSPLQQDACTPTSDVVLTVQDHVLLPLPVVLRAFGHHFGPLDAHLVPTSDGAAASFVLEGLLDTRDFTANLGAGPFGVCGTVEQFGSTCLPCPDGEPFCLAIEIADVLTQPVDVDVVARDPATIEADASCP